MLAKYIRLRFHYGWLIAIITFLALLASAGMRSTPSVLIVPLEKNFGWSNATISFAISINLVLYGLSGPFAAALMQRMGIRRVMIGALILIALACGLTTVMTAPWQLDLLWGVLVGLATGSIASVLAALIANRWFVKNRGLVMGLLTASNATGQLVFLPLLASLAVSWGWRASAWATAIAALILLPLVILLFSDHPRDIGLRPYGADPEEEDPSNATNATGNPFSDAIKGLVLGMRSKDFWLLAGSFFICGASTNGLIGTHLIPASMDHGISEVTAASMLALIGIFDLIGTTVSGWLSDRVDARWLLCWYYGLRGLSLLLLPYALGSTYLLLLVFIVFYGLDWVATVPPTSRLAADIFGKEQVAIVYGWIFAAHQFGAATAAYTAGALRTTEGSYQISFISAGILCLFAAGMVIRIGRTRREQVAIEIPVESASALQ
ncbi:MFS transporter [Ktedonobacter racemifer]|uniref:Major facilitator superfamily MFS_1 n=1 Tax=Ktedonobacter racemifer DSM 44963 TaxID=485913 RepID=D6U6K1_KTERA|nr:MFS transporter [Ktedonobacter racemifer]EFH80612.1 major facilitator superfamily MFS_1 [Ktedonobacter racemifer DSM 44963]